MELKSRVFPSNGCEINRTREMNRKEEEEKKRENNQQTHILQSDKTHHALTHNELCV